MHKEGVSNLAGNKVVALKKNTNFVYIVSGNQIKERKDYKLVEKYGKDFKNSGYRVELSKNLLEKGTYTVFHIIRDKEKKYHLKNTHKRIVIE